MALDIQVVGDPQGRGFRVTLRGRLDTVTAAELDTRLAPILSNAANKSLVFDLGELEYISSAGVQSFVRARKALEGRGGTVALLNPRPPVKKSSTSSRRCRWNRCFPASRSSTATSTASSGECRRKAGVEGQARSAGSRRPASGLRGR